MSSTAKWIRKLWYTNTSRSQKGALGEAVYTEVNSRLQVKQKQRCGVLGVERIRQGRAEENGQKQKANPKEGYRSLLSHNPLEK